MPKTRPVALSPILIVDDVACEAVTLERLCHLLGVETMRVANLAEAGAILATMRPAAVITDLVTDGAQGMDCLDLIAEHVPTVPIMVITPSERMLLKAADELGGSYGLSDLTCVVKPVGLPTLTAFIAHTGLKSRSSSQSLD